MLPLNVKFDEHDFEASLMGASRLDEGETVDARCEEPCESCNTLLRAPEISVDARTSQANGI